MNIGSGRGNNEEKTPVANGGLVVAGRKASQNLRLVVKGGGCMTVGVAGLVQGRGFGSCSRRFGTAAAALLEAEIVTADGQIRVVNECTDADLFWALKGGGGGTFGVLTRLTLRTHELPKTSWRG